MDGWRDGEFGSGQGANICLDTVRGPPAGHGEKSNCLSRHPRPRPCLPRNLRRTHHFSLLADSGTVISIVPNLNHACRPVPERLSLTQWLRTGRYVPTGPERSLLSCGKFAKQCAERGIESPQPLWTGLYVQTCPERGGNSPHLSGQLEAGYATCGQVGTKGAVRIH